MQIFPDSHEYRYSGYDTGTLSANLFSQQNIPQHAPFANVMNRLQEQAERSALQAESLANTGAGQSTSYDDISYADNTRGIQANPAGADTMQVSREDLRNMKDNLREQGLSEENIRELEDRIDSEEGLSWREMTEFIAEKLNLNTADIKPDIGQVDKVALLSFFQKAGFTAQESSKLVNDLARNKRGDVLSAISEKINSLSPKQLDLVTKQELTALGRALSLNQISMGKLNAQLNAAPNINGLNERSVKSALNLITTEVVKTSKAGDSKTDEIRAMLAKGIQDAEKREEIQNLSNNKETRDVADQKVMIKDAAEEKYGGRDDSWKGRLKGDKGQENDPGPKAADASPLKGAPEDDESDAALMGNKGDKLKQGGEKGENGEGLNEKVKDAAEAVQNAGKKTPSQAAEAKDAEVKAKTGQPVQNAEKKAPDFADADADAERGLLEEKEGFESALLNQHSGGKNKHKGGAGREQPGQQGRQQAQDTAKAEFMGKVEVSGESAADFTVTQTAAENSSAKNATAFKARPTAFKDLPQQKIFDTVQKGILTNTQQGRSQITLKLDPANLGKLTVILQVKNNEVRALIKAEDQDVGKMLQDNMQALRAGLEQQGLKVEKLDVQTQLNDEHHSREWQGMEQHNMSREQGWEQSMLNTWKKLRNQGEKHDPLAQGVQNERPTVNISHDGVDIIA